jgi:hypothetical protein
MYEACCFKLFEVCWVTTQQVPDHQQYCTYTQVTAGMADLFSS